MNKLIDQLLKFDRKLQLTILGCVIFLIVVEAWLFLFREPLTTFKQLRNEDANLTQLSVQGTDLDAHIKRLSLETQQLSEQLYGNKLPVPAQQWTLQLASMIDQLASANGVEITSIKPAISSEGNEFKKIELQITASGDYLTLAKWIQSLQEITPPVILNKMQIKTNPLGGIPQLQMQLLSFVPNLP